MVNLNGIDSQVAAIVGSGPAGNPAAIRACAEEFRADARQVGELANVVKSSHVQLEFEGPAADRLKTSVAKYEVEIQQCSARLAEIARTLDHAAGQLAADQRAHGKRVASVREQLVSERTRAAAGS